MRHTGYVSNIRHLTDVSHCKLHQHLSCNLEIKCQQVAIALGAWPGGVTNALPDRLEQPGKEADGHHRAHSPDRSASPEPHHPAAKPAAPAGAAHAARL